MSNSFLDDINFFGLKIKKKYGQNFLIDKNIIHKIITAIDIRENDAILEIGAGLGALTQYLIRAKKVIAIEIDGDLVRVLKNKFNSHKNLELIQADILKIDLDDILKNFEDIKIVSNLPYYISTAVITKCLFLKNIKSMTFMLQKEVGERILSSPSTESYGSLSVLTHYFSEPKIITYVSPNCFVPKPNVNSVVINMTVHKKNICSNEKFLFDIIRQAFSKRRKTLLNCLNNFHGLSKQKIAYALSKINRDRNTRGESLTLDEFIKLADALQRLINE